MYATPRYNTTGAGLQSRSTSELLDPVARKKWTEWADTVNRDYGGAWLYNEEEEVRNV